MKMSTLHMFLAVRNTQLRSMSWMTCLEKTRWGFLSAASVSNNFLCLLFLSVPPSRTMTLWQSIGSQGLLIERTITEPNDACRLFLLRDMTRLMKVGTCLQLSVHWSWKFTCVQFSLHRDAIRIQWHADNVLKSTVIYVILIILGWEAQHCGRGDKPIFSGEKEWFFAALYRTWSSKISQTKSVRGFLNGAYSSAFWGIHLTSFTFCATCR